MTSLIALDAGLDFIMQAQRDGHQDDDAPGEHFRTAWGVTQETWDDAVARGIVSGELSNATRDQCAAIYQVDYYNALLCNMLPSGVAFVLFVDATLTGVGHVARLLQRIVGVAQDGVVGHAVTIPAVDRYVSIRGQRALIDALIAADETYLATLVNSPRFIRGWDGREQAERPIAYGLAGINIGPVKPTVVAAKSADQLNAAELETIAKDT